MIEQTLIIIKPDGVERGLTSRILVRFEESGLKIVGLKMAHISKTMAMEHYTEELGKRRGEHIRTMMIDYISQGPVVAAVIEGVNAVEVVRKMTGDTEPKSAQPGTIRGDFTHMSFAYADRQKLPVKNVIHASSLQEDAKREISLWFKPQEIHKYKSVHDVHLL